MKLYRVYYRQDGIFTYQELYAVSQEVAWSSVRYGSMELVAVIEIGETR